MERKYHDETGMAIHVLYVITLLDPQLMGEYSSDVLRAKLIDMVLP